MEFALLETERSLRNSLSSVRCPACPLHYSPSVCWVGQRRQRQNAGQVTSTAAIEVLHTYITWPTDVQNRKISRSWIFTQSSTTYTQEAERELTVSIESFTGLMRRRTDTGRRMYWIMSLASEKLLIIWDRFTVCCLLHRKPVIC